MIDDLRGPLIPESVQQRIMYRRIEDVIESWSLLEGRKY